MPLSVEIVTVERTVLTQDGIDEVIAPGIEGELAVLPQHAAFMTMLKPGELILKRGNDEIPFSVTGGFFEVLDDKVIVLADAAERADEIDIARAEEARERARLAIERRESTVDIAAAQAALQRALIRLRVAEQRRQPGVDRHAPAPAIRLGVRLQHNRRATDIRAHPVQGGGILHERKALIILAPAALVGTHERDAVERRANV